MEGRFWQSSHPSVRVHHQIPLREKQVRTLTQLGEFLAHVVTVTASAGDVVEPVCSLLRLPPPRPGGAEDSRRVEMTLGPAGSTAVQFWSTGRCLGRLGQLRCWF